MMLSKPTRIGVETARRGVHAAPEKQRRRCSRVLPPRNKQIEILDHQNPQRRLAAIDTGFQISLLFTIFRNGVENNLRIRRNFALLSERFLLIACLIFSCIRSRLKAIGGARLSVKIKKRQVKAPAAEAAVPAVGSPGFHWTRDNVVALTTKLRVLKGHRKIRFRDVVVGSGLAKSDDDVDLAQQRFSRWIHNAEKGERWRAVTEAEYKRILDYLNEKSLLATSPEQALPHDFFPDAMFHGVAQWLEMRSDSHEMLRMRFPGEYTAYRHSLLKPGYIIVGSLDIVYNPASRAVITRERYTVDGSPATSATEFEMVGYLFRRNNRYRILSKDVGTLELQHIYIDSTSIKGGVVDAMNIERMMGVVNDVQDNKFYSTRICFRRGRPERRYTVPVAQAKELGIPELLAPLTFGPDTQNLIVTF
jgi:hypothetical protein